jgi:GNAT superfamily N-acetyltransferase
LIVRDLAPPDRAQWDQLWAGYLAFYETRLDAAVTETTWRRFHDPAEPMFALVAERDGALIGTVHVVLHRGTWSIGDFCYLEDLFVAPEARGLGAGRALIEAVYTRADALSCSRVYWLTHDSNPARKLYDQVARNLGFIQYRR